MLLRGFLAFGEGSARRKFEDFRETLMQEIPILGPFWELNTPL